MDAAGFIIDGARRPGLTGDFEGCRGCEVAGGHVESGADCAYV